MTTSDEDTLFDEELPFWMHEEPGNRHSRIYIVDETEHYVLAVVPMGFNDRICLARKAFWGRGWDAGYCFDKGGAAFVEALRFNPERWQRPQGFKKIAFDTRPVVTPDTKQLVCNFCAGDRKLVDAARATEFNVDPRAENVGSDAHYGSLDLACVCCGSCEPPYPVSQRRYAWYWTAEDTIRAFRTPRGRVAY